MMQLILHGVVWWSGSRLNQFYSMNNEREYAADYESGASETGGRVEKIYLKKIQKQISDKKLIKKCVKICNS